MIVDGKKMSEEIKASLKEEVLKLGEKFRLAIVKIGSNPTTEKFLEQKKKFAQDIGVSVRVYDFPENISTNSLRKEVSRVVHITKNTGVIVQLPLPKSVKTDYVLDALISKKDPDMLSSKSVGLFVSGRSTIFPPVVGAVKHILEKNFVELEGIKVVVMGSGKLVGKPIAIWLINQGSTVTVLNEYTLDPKHFTLNADIIISGVGKPNLIIPEMVKDGVVAIDCGISTENIQENSLKTGGRLVGDIDPKVERKASIFTPVPGGVGPLTIAMLFSNLVQLAKTR